MIHVLPGIIAGGGGVSAELNTEELHEVIGAAFIVQAKGPEVSM